MATDVPIQGQVAKILNERELVINRGLDHGVGVGMRFAVLNRNGINIKDPETGKPLGSVPVAKTIVKIVRAEPNLSVGRTFRTVQGHGFGIAAMAALGSPSRPETLRAGERTVFQELSEEESSVKTGDPVIEVHGDEFTLPEL